MIQLTSYQLLPEVNRVDSGCLVELIYLIKAIYKKTVLYYLLCKTVNIQ
jgi:ABC-type transporter Mla MlaB component